MLKKLVGNIIIEVIDDMDILEEGQICKAQSIYSNGDVEIKLTDCSILLSSDEYKLLACDIPLPLSIVVQVIKEDDIWKGTAETLKGLPCNRFEIQWDVGLRDVLNINFDYELESKVSFVDALMAYKDGKTILSLLSMQSYKYNKDMTQCFDDVEILGEWIICD